MNYIVHPTKKLNYIPGKNFFPIMEEINFSSSISSIENKEASNTNALTLTISRMEHLRRRGFTRSYEHPI